MQHCSVHVCAYSVLPTEYPVLILMSIFDPGVASVNCACVVCSHRMDGEAEYYPASFSVWSSTTINFRGESAAHWILFIAGFSVDWGENSCLCFILAICGPHTHQTGNPPSPHTPPLRSDIKQNHYKQSVLSLTSLRCLLKASPVSALSTLNCKTALSRSQLQ